jgi:membrane protein required for colicin V production
VTILYLLLVLAYEVGYGRAERPDWMLKSRTYPLLNASSRAIVDFVKARRKANEEAENRLEKEQHEEEIGNSK